MPWARLSIRYPQELDDTLRRLRQEEYPENRAEWHEWLRYALYYWTSLTPADRHEVITEIRKQLAGGSGNAEVNT